MELQTPAFWSRPAGEVLAGLETTPAGLSVAEAASRLKRYAPRHLAPRKRTDAATLLLAPVHEPDRAPAPGRRRALALPPRHHRRRHHPRHRAGQRAARLLAGARRRRSRREAARARRGQGDGPARRHARARSPSRRSSRATSSSSRPAPSIPGDCLLLESKDLFVDEAALTGETFPVEKVAGDPPGRHAPRQADQRRSSWAPTSSAARPRRVVARPGRTPSSARSPSACGCARRRPSSSAASALRLPAGGGHAGAGDRHLRDQRLPPPPGPRLVPLLAGARGRPDAPAAAGDHQHQPRPRRAAHGRSTRSSSSASPPSRTSAA